MFLSWHKVSGLFWLDPTRLESTPVHPSDLWPDFLKTDSYSGIYIKVLLARRITQYNFSCTKMNLGIHVSGFTSIREESILSLLNLGFRLTIAVQKLVCFLCYLCLYAQKWSDYHSSLSWHCSCLRLQRWQLLKPLSTLNVVCRLREIPCHAGQRLV